MIKNQEFLELNINKTNLKFQLIRKIIFKIQTRNICIFSQTTKTQYIYIVQMIIFLEISLNNLLKYKCL